MHAVSRWAISSGALYLTILILQAFGLARDEADRWYSWPLAAMIMGLVNAVIRPVVRLLAAPLNCLTFGLVGIAVNAMMFWLIGALAEAAGQPVFQVKPLGAVLGSVLVGIITGVANKFVVRERHEE
jgi:putative membrane protein